MENTYAALVASEEVDERLGVDVAGRHDEVASKRELGCVLDAESSL